MTTIVYFRDTMAADRFVSANCGASVYMDKLVATPEGVLGVAGDMRAIEILANWLAENSPETDRCVDEDGNPICGPDVEAILVRPDRTCWLCTCESEFWTKVDTHLPVAIGSGAQYAAGAAWAHTGPTDSCAEFGVRVAALFDAGTKVDGGVQVLYLQSPEPHPLAAEVTK